MGWFWADAAGSAQGVSRNPHANLRPAGAPPPGCPMHNPARDAPPPTQLTAPTSSCPYTPPDPTAKRTDAAPDSSRSATTLSKLNPLNYMPSFIPNTRSENQSVSLPLSREASTIPRGDGSGTNWEYPSPQQMYNAMLKKGYTDTPAADVPAMVRVHNFLNEGAWAEIREWERRFGPGLAAGWRASRRGEQNAALEAERVFSRWERDPGLAEREGYREPALVRFMGRPNEMTPKARLMGVAAWLMPGSFASEPPFDRHDWYVRRYDERGLDLGERRYVIDYYSGEPEADGEPVFYLDVRPAVDGPVSAAERLLRWYGDFWWRAMGAEVAEQRQQAS